MFGKKAQRSPEALKLDIELQSWFKKSLAKAKQPWLDDVVKALQLAKEDDFEGAFRILERTALTSDAIRPFLESACKTGSQLLSLLTGFERMNREAEEEKCREQVRKLLNSVFTELGKYQQGITEATWTQTRVEEVIRSHEEETERQSSFKYSFHPIKPYILASGVPTRVFDSLYVFSDWAALRYLEVTESVMQKLNEDSELLSLESWTKLGIPRLHGFVSHDQRVNNAIQRVLSGCNFPNPLIVLKHGFAFMVFTHELTHACIRHVDVNLHEQPILHPFSYEDTPEEILAFMNSILLYRLLHPADTFNDFLRIQEKTNIDSHDMLQTARAFATLEKDMFQAVDKCAGGKVTSHNIERVRDAMVDRFIAPALGRSSYTLLSRSNAEGNTLLRKGLADFENGRHKEALSIYGSALSKVHDARAIIEKRISLVSSILTRDALVRGNGFIENNNLEKAIEAYEDALETASPDEKRRIGQHISNLRSRSGIRSIDICADELLDRMVRKGVGMLDLMRLVDSDDEAEVRAAIKMLGSQNETYFLTTLLRADWRFSGLVVEELVRRSDAYVISRVGDLLRDCYFRQEAEFLADVLARIGKADAVRELWGAYGCSVLGPRVAAKASLLQIGQFSRRRALRLSLPRILRSASGAIREVIGAVLGGIRDAVRGARYRRSFYSAFKRGAKKADVEQQLDRLKTIDSGYWDFVVSALSKACNAASVPLLGYMYEHSRAHEKEVIGVLGMIGDQTAVQVLLKVLRDPTSFYTKDAIEAIVQTGDKSALPVLREVSRDERYRGDMREATIDAVMRMELNDASPSERRSAIMADLLEKLENSKNYFVRLKAARFLIKTPDRSIVPVILRVLMHENQVKMDSRRKIQLEFCKVMRKLLRRLAPLSGRARLAVYHNLLRVFSASIRDAARSGR